MVVPTEHSTVDSLAGRWDARSVGSKAELRAAPKAGPKAIKKAARTAGLMVHWRADLRADLMAASTAAWLECSWGRTSERIQAVLWAARLVAWMAGSLVAGSVAQWVALMAVHLDGKWVAPRAHRRAARSVARWADRKVALRAVLMDGMSVATTVLKKAAHWAASKAEHWVEWTVLPTAYCSVETSAACWVVH